MVTGQRSFLGVTKPVTTMKDRLLAIILSAGGQIRIY